MRIRIYLLILIAVFIFHGKSLKAQFIVVTDPILATALCNAFPAAMSGDCLSLDTVAALSKTGTLQMQYYGFTSVSELKYFKNIIFLQTVDNNISNLPDLSGFNSMTAIDIRGNPWIEYTQLEPVKNQLVTLLLRKTGGTEPTIKDFSFLNTFPNLKSIEFKDFGALKMPDFSLYSGLTLIDIRGNKFSFKDLLPLTTYSGTLGANLLLFPQKKLSNDTIITVFCNNALTLKIPFDEGVSGITYDFYKDNSLLQSSSANVFHLDKMTEADTGIYRVEIRSNHPLFSGDSLLTGNYTIRTNASNNCQDLFSPNNDGIEDELYIEGSGEALIRNKQGVVVRKMFLPGMWDGKDNFGNPVAIGLYSITTSIRVTTVTVIR